MFYFPKLSITFETMSKETKGYFVGLKEKDGSWRYPILEVTRKRFEEVKKKRNEVPAHEIQNAKQGRTPAFSTGWYSCHDGKLTHEELSEVNKVRFITPGLREEMLKAVKPIKKQEAAV